MIKTKIYYVSNICPFHLLGRTRCIQVNVLVGQIQQQLSSMKCAWKFFRIKQVEQTRENIASIFVMFHTSQDEGPSPERRLQEKGLKTWGLDHQIIFFRVVVVPNS